MADFIEDNGQWERTPTDETRSGGQPVGPVASLRTEGDKGLTSAYAHLARRLCREAADTITALRAKVAALEALGGGVEADAIARIEAWMDGGFSSWNVPGHDLRAAIAALKEPTNAE